MEKKYRRAKSLKKTLKSISEIKERVPKIIFKAQNLVVTLRNKSQLKRWKYVQQLLLHCMQLKDTK